MLTPKRIRGAKRSDAAAACLLPRPQDAMETKRFGVSKRFTGPFLSGTVFLYSDSKRFPPLKRSEQIVVANKLPEQLKRFGPLKRFFEAPKTPQNVCM